MELLPSSLCDATGSPFCRLCDIFPQPGEVFLMEGGFGEEIKFAVLPRSLPLGEVAQCKL